MAKVPVKVEGLGKGISPFLFPNGAKAVIKEAVGCIAEGEFLRGIGFSLVEEQAAPETGTVLFNGNLVEKFGGSAKTPYGEILLSDGKLYLSDGTLLGNCPTCDFIFSINDCLTLGNAFGKGMLLTYPPGKLPSTATKTGVIAPISVASNEQVELRGTFVIGTEALGKVIAAVRSKELLYVICEKGAFIWSFIYKVRTELSEKCFKGAAWASGGALAVTKGGSLCLLGKDGLSVLGYEWLFRRKVVRMWAVEEFGLTFIRDETEGILYVWKGGLTRVGEDFISVSFDRENDKLVGLCSDGRILELFLHSEEGESSVSVKFDKCVFGDKDVKWFHGIDLWMSDKGEVAFDLLLDGVSLEVVQSADERMAPIDKEALTVEGGFDVVGEGGRLFYDLTLFVEGKDQRGLSDVVSNG